MSDKRWKQVEREVAAIFGSQRIPLSGINSRHNTSSDTDNKIYYIEVKHGKRWLPLLSKIKCYHIINNEWEIYQLKDFKDLSKVQGIQSIFGLTYTHSGLVNLLNDTLVKANKEDKIPVLVLHPYRKSIGESFVFIHRNSRQKMYETVEVGHISSYD